VDESVPVEALIKLPTEIGYVVGYVVGYRRLKH
jgi:hypothetical protein